MKLNHYTVCLIGGAALLCSCDSPHHIQQADPHEKSDNTFVTHDWEKVKKVLTRTRVSFKEVESIRPVSREIIAKIKSEIESGGFVYGMIIGLGLLGDAEDVLMLEKMFEQRTNAVNVRDRVDYATSMGLNASRNLKNKARIISKLKKCSELGAYTHRSADTAISLSMDCMRGLALSLDQESAEYLKALSNKDYSHIRDQKTSTHFRVEALRFHKLATRLIGYGGTVGEASAAYHEDDKPERSLEIQAYKEAMTELNLDLSDILD